MVYNIFKFDSKKVILNVRNLKNIVFFRWLKINNYLFIYLNWLSRAIFDYNLTDFLQRSLQIKIKAKFIVNKQIIFLYSRCHEVALFKLVKNKYMHVNIFKKNISIISTKTIKTEYSKLFSTFLFVINIKVIS